MSLTENNDKSQDNFIIHNGIHYTIYIHKGT